MLLTRWIDIERLIHSFKTAIACILGFLLTKIVGFPADQWIVITIIVVMCAQIYVGSVLQKAYLRFLGTLAGCIFAALVIETLGEDGFSVAIAIGVSSFIFSYLATGQESLTYTGTLGAVTTAIIMLGQTPTVAFAAERFLEISIGILIATLVSQFFLPINARDHIRRAQAETLIQLRDYYVNAMMNPSTTEKKDFYELDESIVKTLLKQRQLAKESVREPLGEAFNAEHFMQTLYCEKEILRAMDFMHKALIQIKHIGVLQLSALHVFNETILQSFNTMIKMVGEGVKPQDHIHIPSIKELKQDIQTNIINPSREELIYIDGFLFSAEMLTITLSRLANLNHIPIFETK